MNADILIVDDERTLRESLAAVLEAEGYAVRMARDGEDALRKIADARPDLVLLDVMMPKMNGFRTCESIRKMDPLLPVIFLTAKSGEGDQIRGLGLGADDYVSKDASDSVLLARMARALSRADGFDRKLKAEGGESISLGRVTVDFDKLTVTECGTETGRLTFTEASILKLLYGRRGHVFSKDEIIDGLRGSGFACEETMVYVHVSNLRRKLGSAAPLLVSHYHVGYSLSMI